MLNPLELTVGDVHLLLDRCFDGPERAGVIRRLEFMHGEILVKVEMDGEFHGTKSVRIVETNHDFIVCVQDKVSSKSFSRPTAF